ncbi:MAG: RtcB family protein [Verrucomicrobia bacterium]|nr:RtcB family protein [Verrucomicrobiota bacterium]
MPRMVWTGPLAVVVTRCTSSQRRNSAPNAGWFPGSDAARLARRSSGSFRSRSESSGIIWWLRAFEPGAGKALEVKGMDGHRTGQTQERRPGEGVLGIIPGSMASPGYLVRGKGNVDALLSASQGAGRVMSRTKALETFEWGKVNRILKERGVILISAGLDEVPGVYRNIHQVMAAQADLVDVLGRFDPNIVKMAPHGERPED